MHTTNSTLGNDIKQNTLTISEDNSNSLVSMNNLGASTGEVTALTPCTFQSSLPEAAYLDLSSLDHRAFNLPQTRSRGVILETQNVCEISKPPRPNKEPTAQDWATHRHIFTELYSVHNKTLNEVMEIMRIEYHFRATPRMFKQRIRSWGLKKYFKPSKVPEQDLSSQFNHGTNQMIANELVHHLEFSETDQTSKSPKRKKIRGEVSDSQSSSQYSLSAPARSLSMPSQLKYPELLFHQISIFYSSAFESTMQGSFNEDEVLLSGEFCHTIDKALSSLQRGIYHPAQQKIGWQLLNEALDSVQSLFCNKNSHILRYLLRYTQRWYASASPKLFRVLWNHISEMASLLLTEKSPITLACRSITHLDHSYEVYETAFELILSNVEQSLGCHHDETSRIKEMYLSLLIESGHLDTAENLQRRLLKQYQNSDEYSQESMWAMYGLGLIMEKMGDFLRAEEAYSNASLRGKVFRGENYPSLDDVHVMQHHIRMLSRRNAFADCISILSEALEMCLASTSRLQDGEPDECLEKIFTQLDQLTTEQSKTLVYSEGCASTNTTSETDHWELYTTSEEDESNRQEVVYKLEEDEANERAIAHLIWLMARENDDRSSEQVRIEEDQVNEQAIAELIQEMVEDDERNRQGPTEVRY